MMLPNSRLLFESCAYPFSAASAASSGIAWGNAPGTKFNRERAPKARLNSALNRAFSAGICLGTVPAALPQANMNVAPWALNGRDR